MEHHDNDALERAITRALGPDDSPPRTPDGFAQRVEACVYYAALLERRRSLLRRAAALGAGSTAVFLIVLGLFVQTVDVPGWVIENVPGVLGRFDALRVGVERSPLLAFAAVGAVLLTLAGAASAALRPRRSQGHGATKAGF